MGSWTNDLSIEEKRIRLMYKLFHGFLDSDIRDLRIPGDVRTAWKTSLEIKGWNRNGWLPLETWSVLENEMLGWAWTSSKVTVYFVRIETEEAVAIPLPIIKNWMEQTKASTLEILTCKCGTTFEVPQHIHPAIAKQDIQWSNHGLNHLYHSACLFVEEEAFPEITSYLCNPSMQKAKGQYRLLERIK